MAQVGTRDDSQEAFNLFDKKGRGTIPIESLGEILRALGQNPTQAEVAELQVGQPKELSYDAFLKILNRPDGWKKQATPDGLVGAFRVFDKDNSGKITRGQLKYILTSFGEPLSAQEVEEILKVVSGTSDGEEIQYQQLVNTILSM